MAQFSDAEKAVIYRHLGYPYAKETAALTAGGLAVLQMIPLVERQMELLDGVAKPAVMELATICSDVEDQQRKLMKQARAEKAGEVTLRRDAFEELTRQYDAWVAKLSAALAAPRSPFDPRLEQRGGVNGTWTT